MNEILSLLFSPKECIGVIKYWLVGLPLGIAASFLRLNLGGSEQQSFLALIPILILILIFTYCVIVLSIKRAHDRGRSGWFLLLLFIPTLNLWPMVELCFVPGLKGAQRSADPSCVTKNKDSKLSWLALISFLCGMGWWLGLLEILILGDIFGIADSLTCRSHERQLKGLAEILQFMIVLSPVVAFVTGLVGHWRIKRSQGRLKGDWLAQLGLLGSVMVVLMLMSLPGFLAYRDYGLAVVDRPLTQLHQAEEQYRQTYPEIGYSRDLQSLGPPAGQAAPSAERAGLVSADHLGMGRYFCDADTVSYAPRLGTDGEIVGYTIHVKTRVLRVMDESGEIRIESAPIP